MLKLIFLLILLLSLGNASCSACGSTSPANTKFCPSGCSMVIVSGSIQSCTCSDSVQCWSSASSCNAYYSTTTSTSTSTTTTVSPTTSPTSYSSGIITAKLKADRCDYQLEKSIHNTQTTNTLGSCQMADCKYNLDTMKLDCEVSYDTGDDNELVSRVEIIWRPYGSEQGGMYVFPDTKSEYARNGKFKVKDFLVEDLKGVFSQIEPPIVYMHFQTNTNPVGSYGGVLELTYRSNSVLMRYHLLFMLIIFSFI